MRRLALLFLFLLAAAALGLWWLDGRRGGPARAGAETARAPEPARPAELAPAAAGEPAVRETLAAEPDQPPAAETAAAPAPPAAGVRLRGVLRYSHDLRPAAGQPLGFLSGDAHARVVTDAAGRFETEPVMPSGLAYAWHALEGEEHSRAMKVEPARLIVRDDLGDERMQDVELLLVEPDAWLHVLVTADGSPAPARVYWRSADVRGSDHTDENGRLEIALTRLQPGVELRLWAETSDAVSPRARRVSPWRDELVPLALQPAGRVRARVREEGGRPLEGAFVRVENGGWGETDADGEARVAPVFAGPAVVTCDGQRREVAVAGGEQAEVEFVFPDSEVVAAGRVLDEGERPLSQVWVGAANVQGAEAFASARTDDGGLFELRARPGRAAASLWVNAGGGVEDDLYEPAEQQVPSGSSALVFRRKASPETVELSLAAFDALTRQPIQGARFLLYRRDWPANFDLYGTDGGMGTCTLRPYDDVLVRVNAVGYVSRTITWADVPADSRAGKPLCLELVRGFEQELAVLDAETQLPLPGASILAGDAPAATTDAHGRASLHLPAWPPGLRVELAGYVAQEFDQKDIACTGTLSCALARE